MAAESKPLHRQDGDQPTKLKLVMPSPSKRKFSESEHDLEPVSNAKERSGSPTRPSYSPVTPPPSHSYLTHGPPRKDIESEERWMKRPEDLPISIDDNSDAIALRAALSILQMQRQQSLKDIRKLDHIKQEAFEDPRSFVNDLSAGKLSAEPRHGIDVDVDADDTEEETDANPTNASRFGRMPTAQNVVRAPPIEWAKYRIIGDPLDRLHEVQRYYPGWTPDMADAPQLSRPHELAAPYQPFSDRFDGPPTPAGQSRRRTSK